MLSPGLEPATSSSNLSAIKIRSRSALEQTDVHMRGDSCSLRLVLPASPKGVNDHLADYRLIRKLDGSLHETVQSGVIQAVSCLCFALSQLGQNKFLWNQPFIIKGAVLNKCQTNPFVKHHT